MRACVCRFKCEPAFAAGTADRPGLFARDADGRLYALGRAALDPRCPTGQSLEPPVGGLSCPKLLDAPIGSPREAKVGASGSMGPTSASLPAPLRTSGPRRRNPGTVPGPLWCRSAARAGAIRQSPPPLAVAARRTGERTGLLAVELTRLPRLRQRRLVRPHARQVLSECACARARFQTHRLVAIPSGRYRPS